MDLGFDDDDDETFHIYENVQWYWDDKSGELKFKSEQPIVQEDIHPMTTGILGSVDFREVIDLNEQQKFKKRFQRKYGPTDVVTLQDVKDVVLFTAPLKVLTPAVIRILHQAASERLIRALILYCQYYLQISDKMKARMVELQTKIRTDYSDATEAAYRENLECLRLLVGKEYAAYITGSGEFAKYHHMGQFKNKPSLLKKERLMFETFLRIKIQMVWIALGRKSFSQIELEVHRIFKSHIFNIAQHIADRTSKSNTTTAVPKEIQSIFIGECMLYKMKVNTRSPIVDEVQCASEIDYRVFGLGIVRFPRMNERLRYLENALSLPESKFKDEGVFMGILGLKRNGYDIMLNEITVFELESLTHRSSWRASKTLTAAASKQSGTFRDRKSATHAQAALKREMIIPPPEEIELLDEFPDESIPHRPRDKVQRSKWLHRCSGSKKDSFKRKRT